MAEESENKITPEQRRQAVKEYHDAKGKEEKAAVVEKFPFLSEIYSQINHS